MAARAEYVVEDVEFVEDAECVVASFGKAAECHAILAMTNARSNWILIFEKKLLRNLTRRYERNVYINN